MTARTFVLLAAIALPQFAHATIIGGNLQPMIFAGDAAGSPADTPANRVDPNTSGSRYAGVGAVTNVGGGLRGSGVPISPYHILTAGHVVDSNDDGIVDATPGSIRFRTNAGATVDHLISQIDIHPDFDGFNSPIGMEPDGNVHDDLAVLTLASPLPSGIPIYSLLTTETTAGQVFTMVGYGVTGSGATGAAFLGNSTTKRVGFNARDLVESDLDDEGTSANEVWAFDFDGPSGNGNLGGPTLGNNLETTVGGGDSGGPAFVDAGTELLLAGVLTFAFEFDGGPSYPRFGSGGGGILLYPYLGWLNGFITAVPETSSLLLVGLTATAAILARRVKNPRARQ